jgi:hypothetical protein
MMVGDTFSSTSPFRLVPGLRTQLDVGGHVLVESPVGTVIDAGPDGFSILSLFADPRMLRDAIEALRGHEGFIQAATVISELVENGALVDATGTSTRRGWENPVEHGWTVQDHRRTDSYLAAIRATVRDDDVVYDIGTGSGILAVMAARAGARHVYAIEVSGIGQVAQRVFEVNGVADRITLIRDWSTQVELPEPATVLVSEIIGTEPLEEWILETTLDGRGCASRTAVGSQGNPTASSASACDDRRLGSRRGGMDGGPDTAIFRYERRGGTRGRRQDRGSVARVRCLDARRDDRLPFRPVASGPARAVAAPSDGHTRRHGRDVAPCHGGRRRRWRDARGVARALRDRRLGSVDPRR